MDGLIAYALAKSALEKNSSIGDIRNTILTDVSPDWVLCDGSALDEEEYPKLADVISTNNVNGKWKEKFIDNDASLDDIIQIEDGTYLIAGATYDNDEGDAQPAIFTTNDIRGEWSKVLLDANLGDAECVIHDSAFVVGGRSYNESEGYYFPCIWTANNVEDEWERIDIDQNEGSLYDIIYDNNMLIAIGYTNIEEYDDSVPTIWYTNNVHDEWTKILLYNESGSWISNIIRDEEKLIIIGSHYDDNYGDIFPGIWVANNVYDEWERIDIDQDVGIVYDIIRDNNILIAVGSCNSMPAIWYANSVYDTWTKTLNEDVSQGELYKIARSGDVLFTVGWYYIGSAGQYFTAVWYTDIVDNLWVRKTILDDSMSIYCAISTDDAVIFGGNPNFTCNIMICPKAKLLPNLVYDEYYAYIKAK